MNNVIKVGGQSLAFNVLATRYFATQFNLSTSPVQIVNFLSTLHPDSYMIELIRAGMEGYAKTQNKACTATDWDVAQVYEAGTPEDGQLVFDAFMGSLFRKTTDEARALRIEMEAAKESAELDATDPNPLPLSNGPAGEN